MLYIYIYSEKKHVKSQRPNLAKKYNKSMRGGGGGNVDKIDHLIALYHLKAITRLFLDSSGSIYVQKPHH